MAVEVLVGRGLGGICGAGWLGLVGGVAVGWRLVAEVDEGEDAVAVLEGLADGFGLGLEHVAQHAAAGAEGEVGCGGLGWFEADAGRDFFEEVEVGVVEGSDELGPVRAELVDVGKALGPWGGWVLGYAFGRWVGVVVWGLGRLGWGRGEWLWGLGGGLGRGGILLGEFGNGSEVRGGVLGRRWWGGWGCGCRRLWGR